MWIVPFCISFVVFSFIVGVANIKTKEQRKSAKTKDILKFVFTILPLVVILILTLVLFQPSYYFLSICFLIAFSIAVFILEITLSTKKPIKEKK